jgi:hypothetical protein
VAEPDRLQEELQAGTVALTRVLHAHLTEALSQGRLQGVLGALRGLEHVAGLVGLTAASQAFRLACQDTRWGGSGSGHVHLGNDAPRWPGSPVPGF